MMQLHFLSSLLGLAPTPAAGQAAAQAGAQPGAAAPTAGAFAAVLAAVPPAPKGPEPLEQVPQAFVAPSAVPKSAALLTLEPPAQAAQPIPAATLASAPQVQPAAPGKQAPPTGKSVPPTGKDLPVAPLAAKPATPQLAEPLAEQPPVTATKHEAEAAQPAAPLAEADKPQPFADLALLQGWAPQFAELFNLPVPPRPAPPQPAPTALAERQLAVSTASSMPFAAIVPGAAKERPARTAEPAPQPAPLTNASAFAEPLAERPAAEIILPPLRAATPRALEPASQPVAPAMPPLAAPTPEPHAGEPPLAPPVPDQPAPPAAELGPVIDRLVESRLQAREGKSELNVPHPDFGRVTLALSLAGQDRLSVAMPDAPAELRAAVSQAFAPPPRSEASAPPASGNLASETMASGTDARSSDARREQHQSSGRSDPPRADHAAAQPRQPATNREPARAASGRGVLA